MRLWRSRLAHELRTSDVTLVSHSAATQRPGIQRREPAAIKHPANPGRRGCSFAIGRRLYRRAEAICGSEIPSWRLDGGEAVAEAEASDDDRPTSHVGELWEIIASTAFCLIDNLSAAPSAASVVDHSGVAAARYATRTAAVYAVPATSSRRVQGPPRQWCSR